MRLFRLAGVVGLSMHTWVTVVEIQSNSVGVRYLTTQTGHNSLAIAFSSPLLGEEMQWWLDDLPQGRYKTSRWTGLRTVDHCSSEEMWESHTTRPNDLRRYMQHAAQWFTITDSPSQFCVPISHDDDKLIPVLIFWATGPLYSWR